MSEVAAGPGELLVVTPTLGTSGWLGAAVASVGEFAPGARHLLVAPPGEVARLAREFPLVEVVPERGGGMYAAINAGARAAQDWAALTYLNDDDLLAPGFARARARVGAGAARQVVYGNVALVDAAGRRIGRIPVSRCPRWNRALYAERLEPVYQHGTILTRAAFEDLGGFDESFRLCGDSEILARACVRGIPFAYVGGPALAAFRLRTGQLTKSRAAMLAERHRVDALLGLVPGSRHARHLLARWVFRAGNLSVYAERLARFGWKRFDDVLAAE